jgi:hypothetical protein
MTHSAPTPEDHHWLDVLAGRDVPDAPPDCRVEASWLRAAMLTYREAPPAGDVPNAQVRVRSLLAKAREAGLLMPEPTASAPLGLLRAWWAAWRERGRGPWLSPPALAASIVAVVAAALVVLGPPAGDPEPSVLRGAPSVQVLVTPDPAALQRGIAAQLRAAGLSVAEFERLGRPALEVDVPAVLTADQRAVLGQHGVAAPQSPVLTIEFVRPAGGQ